MHHATTLLAALSLACAVPASAAADAPGAPAPARPAPHGDACPPGGTVLFEIAHRVMPGAKLPTSTVQLFTTGAWTRTEVNRDGQALAPTSGCMARPELKQLADRLHGAPWKVKLNRIRCMAVSATFIEYQLDGKLVFTQKLCSGQVLDDKSRAALDDAIAHLEPPPAAPGPAAPAKP